MSLCVTPFPCTVLASRQSIYGIVAVSHIRAQIISRDKVAALRKQALLLNLTAALSPPDSDSINFMLRQGMRWYGAISTILFGVVALG